MLNCAMSRVGTFLAGTLLLVGAAHAQADQAQGALVPPNFIHADAHIAAQPGSVPDDSRTLPVVIDARIGEHADRTRFVIEISDPFRVRVFTLADPDRVVLDMPEVLWRLEGPPRPSGRGLVKSYRFGQFRAGNSRFVIDLNGPATAARPLLLPPAESHGYRLIIDLYPTSESQFVQNAGWPTDLRASEATQALGVQDALTGSDQRPARSAHAASVSKTSKPVIVLDAGHGGIDSGTMAADGLMEKDVVLDEALRLREALKKRGYAVHLTRDSDTYIPLRERVNIARGYDADLFISLHADSNPDASVSGASVYTLSESGSDKEAAALARKENQSDVIAGVDLAGESSPVASILIGLAQRDTMNRSSRFAEAAVTELSRATDILVREPHRSAGFVVLKAPDVPAVLIELGYLSNARDCAQARTTGWRDGVASAIADAVTRYFGAGTPALAQSTRQAVE